MINGSLAVAPSSGASVPARSQTLARTAARAVLIAANAAGASAARVSISRDTVGSEATCPNTPGSDRTWAMSARQSPPIATAIARSSRTFPGSCTANGRIQGASAVDSSPSRPSRLAVAASSTAPAWDTARWAVVSTISDGYEPVDFDIRKVLLDLVRMVPQQDLFSQFRAPFVMINTASNNSL